MESTELAEYIDHTFTEMQPNFQWKVVKDSAKHIVETFISFKIDVPDHIQVQDSEVTVNEPGIRQFEDASCFYDPSISHVTADHNLKSFNFHMKKAIEQGFVDAT